ncbi:MAG: signal peptidase II [Sphaerochaetaceae bacterium]|jgi:signal peptidase II
MKKYSPLILTASIVVCDQLSKAWVVAHIPENTVGYRLLGGFLEIWHVRNTAIAFSMGENLPLWVKLIGFIILPVALLVAVGYVMFSRKHLVSEHQRWILAAFLGGGMGNLADRIFRHFRVVDFMANRVYGLFGMEFWPTWNIADASLVVSAILLALTLLFPFKSDTLEKKEREKDVKEK